MTSPKAPPNLRSLVTRMENIARERSTPVRRIQRAVANVVVGQLMPPGVVKGGTAIKIRIGESASRFTPDFDTTRHGDLTIEEYLDQLRARLLAGWGGFSGTAEQLEPASPDGVPPPYVMQPFAIRLSYRGKHWLTVQYEVSHDEIGSTTRPDTLMASDLIDLFAQLGLPTPQPVPLLAIEHQVAQKLHACTSISASTGTNDRAHDLVDLQLLIDESPLDLEVLRRTCERLFRARSTHEWPPLIVAGANWPELYHEAAIDLGVIASVEEAVAWGNRLIADIANG